MPLIEIETPPTGVGSPLPSYGTELRLDGHVVQDVVAIHLELDVDNVVTATVRVLATEQFAFVGNADHLHVQAVVLPGYRLVEEVQPDGSKSYRVEPTKDAPPQPTMDVIYESERIAPWWKFW